MRSGRLSMSVLSIASSLPALLLVPGRHLRAKKWAATPAATPSTMLVVKIRTSVIGIPRPPLVRGQGFPICYQMTATAITGKRGNSVTHVKLGGAPGQPARSGRGSVHRHDRHRFGRQPEHQPAAPVGTLERSRLNRVGFIECVVGIHG